MLLTTEQVNALAPDSSSQANAKKYGVAGRWSNAGRTETAAWGECAGSGMTPYQTSIDFSDLATKCSCPSRKYPCKHALGLMWLIATNPAGLPECESPSWWAAEWLDKRAEKAAKKDERAAARKDAPVDEKARAKRQAQRGERVAQGIDGLELWLTDVVRNGLGTLEADGLAECNQQARRLVDSQAPGLASWLRSIADLPGSLPDWPDAMLGHLGRMQLLVHAYRRLDELPADLQEDVRRLIGFNTAKDDVASGGEQVSDTWVVLGQREEFDERLRAQRTWLSGRRSGRIALVMQFAPAMGIYKELIAPGSEFDADINYYPGAWPQRALISDRRGMGEIISGEMPGFDSFASMLDHVAAALAKQPWTNRFGGALRQVVPVPPAANATSRALWQLVDRNGRCLPLAPGDHWQLLAASGGRPVDVAIEWNHRHLTAMAMMADGRYRTLGAGADHA
ncbi:MAG: SWIM zinc finger domain-containing protein [Planctomycetota bacterium]